MFSFKCWLRAIWNVMLQRPTMYRMTVYGGSDVIDLTPADKVVTRCTFVGDVSKLHFAEYFD